MGNEQSQPTATPKSVLSWPLLKRDAPDLPDSLAARQYGNTLVLSYARCLAKYSTTHPQSTLMYEHARTMDSEVKAGHWKSAREAAVKAYQLDRKTPGQTQTWNHCVQSLGIGLSQTN